MFIIVRFEVLVTVTKIIKVFLETSVSRYHIPEDNSRQTEKCIHICKLLFSHVDLYTLKQIQTRVSLRGEVRKLKTEPTSAETNDLNIIHRLSNYFLPIAFIQVHFCSTYN